MGYAVDGHHGGEHRVVNLNAGNRMGGDHPAPFQVGCHVLGKKPEMAFNEPDFSIGDGR